MATEAHSLNLQDKSVILMSMDEMRSLLTPTQMDGLSGTGLAMPETLDQGGDIMDTLDVDMLPMTLDLNINAPDQQFRGNEQELDRHQIYEQEQEQDQDVQTTDAVPTVDTMTGAGAGPLPTGFGTQMTGSGGSTLTDFTKRRNWSQRVLEELKDFLHILTPDGRILYVSPSSRQLTSYDQQELLGKFIIDFIHKDDSGIFVREFNESIASGNPLRFFYRFRKCDGSYTIFESHGHPHLTSDAQAFGPSAGFCRGFFMMARPYPTKNAALLDSFLEHKIENERLMKRIEELKREEADENAEQDRLYREHVASPRTSGTPAQQSQSQDVSRGAPAGTPGDSGGSPIDYQGMPPPAKPTISNTALTRQNLDSVLSAQKPDSIADKMSRYEANSTHLESIELLTGLRYRDGERSHGISTGDTSPALIRGDAGIAILLDRDRDGPKKDKKKQKLADEYVCADCGTLDSPEWRKGPKGPKTLCNACGLRWAKKEKKRSGDDGKNTSPMQGGSSGGTAVGATAMPMSMPTMQQLPGLPMQASPGSSG